MKTLIKNTLVVLSLSINTFALSAYADSEILLDVPVNASLDIHSHESVNVGLHPMLELEVSALRNAVPLWEASNSKRSAWTQHVYRELDRIGTSLTGTVPSDIAAFCPNYKNLSHSNRKAFWTFLISAMTRFESNFNTDTKYTESFNDSKGRRVVSRGLLQLSIESGNAYGCGLKTANDLHDPLKNLSCGIRILNRWMSADKRVAGKVNGGWRGGARYWSVLRTTNTKAYPSIVKWTRELALCN